MVMMEEEIISLIKEEIDSYQDLNAPERTALSRLITKIDAHYTGDENGS